MNYLNYHSNIQLKRNSLFRRNFPQLDSFIDVSNNVISYEGFQYTSYKRFTKDIKRLLRRYNVSIMNITKVTKIFHEDLSELDLYSNIIGHDIAFFDLISINEVEELALTKGDLERLSNNNYLYEYEYKDPIIVDLKRFLKKELLKKKKNKEFLRKMVNSFSRKKLKPFVMNMSSQFDSQLVIRGNEIVPEDTFICREDLNQIYLKLKQLIIKYVDDIFFESYWKTLNQKVLERYK